MFAPEVPPGTPGVDLDQRQVLQAWLDYHRTYLMISGAPYSLDGTAGRPGGRRYTLRWVFMHLIEEYARHNGHADLLRERVDGATGE